MILNNNPYFQANGIPKTKKSVVVFADILGFKEEMRKAYGEGRADELLVKLRAALNESYKFLIYNDKDELGPRWWATKTFTDNIVLGFPILIDGEIEMEEAFSHLGILQLEMIRSGFFIRGGIAIGELYIDNDMVFGDGLIEAYETETRLARDPRIVLSLSALNYLNLHLSYYEQIECSLQYRNLLRDVDGQIFVNYLKTIASAEEEVSLLYDELLEHKSMVEKKFDEFSSNPIIWSKYAWVANYHNYYCDQYEFLNESHKIDPSKLRKYPSRLG